MSPLCYYTTETLTCNLRLLKQPMCHLIELNHYNLRAMYVFIFDEVDTFKRIWIVTVVIVAMCGARLQWWQDSQVSCLTFTNNKTYIGLDLDHEPFKAFAVTRYSDFTCASDQFCSAWSYYSDATALEFIHTVAAVLESAASASPSAAPLGGLLH